MRHKKQTQRFGLVFVLLLIPCCALWFFYRWIFGEDTIIAVPIVLGVVTSYICAYAFTGGRTPIQLLLTTVVPYREHVSRAS